MTQTVVDTSRVQKRRWKRFEPTYKRNHYNEVPLRPGDIVVVWTTHGVFRGVVRYAANEFLHGDFRKVPESSGFGLLEEPIYSGIYDVTILRIERRTG